MGRACSLTEWAHFVKASHKANLSYWWVYCRHCVIAAIAASSPGRDIASINTPDALQAFIATLPMPTAASTEATEPRPLVGRRSVMKAHLAQCLHASAIPPNPIVKRRAGKRGVHCAIAEWAHFDRLEQNGYIGNSNYFPVRCKHCVAAHSSGRRPAPPEVFAGRKESMRSHLARCSFFTGKLPAKRTKDASKLALNERQFFVQLERQPNTYYHYAKCKFCTDAYEAGREAGRDVPPPKVILGRKHNMQTHLANCEHILNHEAVLDDIVMSSDENDENDNDEDEHDHDSMDRPLPLAGAETPRLHALATSATASPLARFLHLPIDKSASSPLTSHASLSRVSSIESNGLRPATTTTTTTTTTNELDTIHAVFAFTLEHNLPFAWVESPAMRALCPHLPTTAELTGPLLRRLLQSCEEALRTRWREMHPGGGWTLVVHLLDETESNVTCVAYVVHPNGLLFPSMLEASLTFTCPLPLLPATIQRHVAQCARQQLHVVAVALPPAAAYFGHLPAQLPHSSFYVRHEAYFTAFCTACSPTTRLVRPLPRNLPDIPSWLHETLSSHFVDMDTRVVLEATSPLFSHLGRLPRALSLASTLHLVGQLYSAVRRLPHALDRLQQALLEHLELAWSACEQPAYVLAYALHPHYRDTALRKARSAFKWSALCDVACYYYERWFQTRPTTLRGDVMAFAHVTQHIYAPSVVSEFPSASDYVLYLGDHAPELAALMDRLNATTTSFEFEPTERAYDSVLVRQSVQYIAYCQPSVRPMPSASEDLAPDARLVQWRSRAAAQGGAGAFSTDDAQRTTKITLHELFEG
ncbi:hypothetical protein SPRG_22139 [Saprolegnia parasitica CBS 223.65]|uniref:Uncharacterized protein n=1 Tax=Saprolegnia parasitica (strain CBS 223.65) TaxID=695850 RepID=A0A067CSN8_SAPPC|nr:hypothetical protein SPRG_22139 [Saprolegnia parasitica CBS 223.65]KDO29812.1 hypothetical protein SPRG_22139 [Saprolegnia parasitica CBS 223.65]|eukprot:XP_012199567.1 hypothetical protein SPRG_22139 [Saprolegnia parasitica CBS 223.65]